MKNKRTLLSQSLAFSLDDLPRKPLVGGSDVAALADQHGLSEAELVMLPYLPPSPVANSNYADIHYDQAEVIAAFTAAGKLRPIDIGHELLKPGAASVPAQGWVVELAPHVKDPAHTGAWCLLTSLGRTAIFDKQFLQTSPVFLTAEIDGKSHYVPGSEHSLALTNTPACYEQLMALADGTDTTSEAAAAETPAEPAAEATGTDATAEAASTAEEVTTEAPVETTLTAAAPAAETVALAEFAALQGSVAALTAERDEATTALAAARGQVEALTASIASLTSERDAATAQLATFQAADTERQVIEAVDSHIRAFKSVPAVRERLLAFARKDLAAFKEFSAATPALSFAAPLQLPGETAVTDSVEPEVREFLAKHGLPIEAYRRGRA